MRQDVDHDSLHDCDPELVSGTHARPCAKADEVLGAFVNASVRLYKAAGIKGLRFRPKVGIVVERIVGDTDLSPVRQVDVGAGNDGSVRRRDSPSPSHLL